MKRRIITTCILLAAMFVTTQTFARRVYVRLADDATAWSHVTEDADNKLITLPAGSTDFVGNVQSQLLQLDEVWVAKGEYTNTGRLLLTDHDGNGWAFGDITFYGGFAGTETNPSQRAKSDLDENGLIEAWEYTNATIFKGPGNSKDTPSSFQMIYVGSNSVLDGVTICENYFEGREASGGVVATSGTLRNCIVRDLTAEGSGGAVNGGGLYVTGGHIESCLFETCTNISPAGGNACYGGAMLIYGIKDDTGGTPTGYVKNSVIRNCRAGQVVEDLSSNNGRGGAIFGKGGAIVENCVIYCNQSTNNGAALYFHENGDKNKHVNRVIGCTVVKNFGLFTGFPNSGYAEFYNCVFWGNSTEPYPLDATAYENTLRFKTPPDAVVAYPYVDGLAHDGTIFLNNGVTGIKNSFTPVVLLGAMNDSSTTGDDPKFKTIVEFPGASTSPMDLIEIRKANWTLTEGSPLINAGVDAPTNTREGVNDASLAASFSGVDALGATRNVGKFDIGAYEFGAGQPPVGNIDVADFPFTMYASEGAIKITGLNAAATVNVYSLNGVLVLSTNVTTSDAQIQMTNKGFYIVSLNINGKLYNQKIVL